MGWRYEEGERRVDIKGPAGRISYVSQWPGVFDVHISVPGESGFEGELLKKLKETPAVPNLFSGIINLLMALFLLGFFLMVVHPTATSTTTTATG